MEGECYQLSSTDPQTRIRHSRQNNLHSLLAPSKTSLTYTFNIMSSLLSRLGGSSSRRSSVSDDPNKPTTSEIKTSPAPGCGPKKKTVYSKEQEDKVGRKIVRKVQSLGIDRDASCPRSRNFGR